jgi:hypothetical protein
MSSASRPCRFTSGYQLHRRMDGAQRRSGLCEEEKILNSLEINPGRPANRLLLYRLPLASVSVYIYSYNGQISSVRLSYPVSSKFFVAGKNGGEKVGSLAETTRGKLLMLLLCPWHRDRVNIFPNYVLRMNGMGVWQQWDYANVEIAVTAGLLLRYEGNPQAMLLYPRVDRVEVSW